MLNSTQKLMIQDCKSLLRDLECLETKEEWTTAQIASEFEEILFCLGERIAEIKTIGYKIE